MTATNHALTGATIALALHGSWLAIPLAFVSHFALDSIPHYGNANPNFVATNSFKRLLIVDATVCVLFALSLTIAQPTHWLIVVLSAFAGTSPDLMWIKQFTRARKHEAKKPLTNWLMKFHSRIQWYERPPGAVVEAVWFILFITIFTQLI